MFSKLLNKLPRNFQEYSISAGIFAGIFAIFSFIGWIYSIDTEKGEESTSLLLGIFCILFFKQIGRFVNNGARANGLKSPFSEKWSEIYAQTCFLVGGILFVWVSINALF